MAATDKLLGRGTGGGGGGGYAPVEEEPEDDVAEDRNEGPRRYIIAI